MSYASCRGTNSGSLRAALSAALSAPFSYSYDSYRLLEMPIVCYARLEAGILWTVDIGLACQCYWAKFPFYASHLANTFTFIGPALRYMIADLMGNVKDGEFYLKAPSSLNLDGAAGSSPHRLSESMLVKALPQQVLDPVQFMSP